MKASRQKVVIIPRCSHDGCEKGAVSGGVQACAYPMGVGVDAMWRAVRRVRLALPIFVSLMAVGKGAHPRDAAVSLIVGDL